MRGCKVFLAQTNTTKHDVKRDRCNQEDADARPISNTAAKWYSPIWLLGNQAHVYQLWTCFQDFGMNQDGKLLPIVTGMCDSSGDDWRWFKSISQMYYLYWKQFLFSWRCRYNLRTRMQLEIRKYLKIQNLFELPRLWKPENQTFTRYSNQTFPLNSHLV